MIRFINVKKTYKSGVEALKGVDFTIDTGEFVFIIGKSGSGKSTLLKCITCEESVTEGKVTIDNFDISHMSRALIPVLRRQIGMIYQDFRLIESKTVRENIAFAGEILGIPKKSLDQTVTLVLNIVGLKDKVDAYPQELSGGEQQRVAIARAMVNNPKLIVADEPTGNLDPETSENIMALLLEINRSGTTVVVCTHDANLVDRMKKRVIEIHKGLVARDESNSGYSEKSAEEQGEPEFGGYGVQAVPSTTVAFGDDDSFSDDRDYSDNYDEDGYGRDPISTPTVTTPIQDLYFGEAPEKAVSEPVISTPVEAVPPTPIVPVEAPKETFVEDLAEETVEIPVEEVQSVAPAPVRIDSMIPEVQPEEVPAEEVVEEVPVVEVVSEDNAIEDTDEDDEEPTLSRAEMKARDKEARNALREAQKASKLEAKEAKRAAKIAKKKQVREINIENSEKWLDSVSFNESDIDLDVEDDDE